MDLPHALAALGLGPTATLEEAQQQYRLLSKRWHPDRFAGDATAVADAMSQTRLLKEAVSVIEAHAGTSRTAGGEKTVGERFDDTEQFGRRLTRHEIEEMSQAIGTESWAMFIGKSSSSHSRHSLLVFRFCVSGDRCPAGVKSQGTTTLWALGSWRWRRFLADGSFVPSGRGPTDDADEADALRPAERGQGDRMGIIAIGDVHGNISALNDLLAQVEREIASDDAVVFLGDYIDRGAHSRDCIDRILDFRNARQANVVCLCGNHDEWLRRTRRDYRAHTWLLATDAFATIRSYSAEAAEALQRAVAAAGAAVYGDDCDLPYGDFFDAMPETHLEFFETLGDRYQSGDCICVHGGVNPQVPGLRDQSRHDVIWGGPGFPDQYAGPETVLYGHRNNAVVDDEGWPSPRMAGRTIGIDTISHGVLTAFRWPDGHVFQSARYREGARERM